MVSYFGKDMQRKNNHLSPIENKEPKNQKLSITTQVSQRNQKQTNIKPRSIKRAPVEKENILERIEKPIQLIQFDTAIDNYEKIRAEHGNRFKSLTKKGPKETQKKNKASVDLVYSTVGKLKENHNLRNRGDSHDFDRHDVTFTNLTHHLIPLKTPSKKLARGGGGFSLKHHQMNAKLNLQNLGFYNKFSVLTNDIQDQYYSAQLTKNNSKSKQIEFTQTFDGSSLNELNSKIQEERINFQQVGYQTTKNSNIIARTFQERKGSQQDCPNFIGILEQDQFDNFRSPTKVRRIIQDQQFSPTTLLKSKNKIKNALMENLNMPLMTITQPPNLSQMSAQKYKQIHSYNRSGLNNSHRDSKALLNKSFKALSKTNNFQKNPQHKCLGPHLYTQQLIGAGKKLEKIDQAIGIEQDCDNHDRRDTQTSEKYEFIIPQMTYEQERTQESMMRKRNSVYTNGSNLFVDDQVCYEKAC